MSREHVLEKPTSVRMIERTERKSNAMRKFKRFLPLYIMFAPVALFYLIFSYLPMLGVVIAFKDYNFLGGIFGSPWVGGVHFERFIQSGDFWQVVGNTISISFLRILFGFPAPIILAILLNEVRNERFKKFVQTATYLPHFISWVVIYGILYNMFSVSGIVNQVRMLLGYETIAYLGRAEFFRPLYVGSAIWKEIGWSAIIYLAALSGVDVQLYEAGMLDGANRWQKLIYITLPSIRNVISIMFVLGLGNILNVGFEQILVMYNSTVSSVAEVLDYYIYRVGLLQANNFSYATAVGLFRSLISLFLVLGTNYVARKIDEEACIW